MRKLIKDEAKRDTEHPTSEIIPVARKASGTHEIDVRDLLCRIEGL